MEQFLGLLKGFKIELEQGSGPPTSGWNRTGQDWQAIAILRIMSRTSSRRLELELELNRPGRLVPPGNSKIEQTSEIKDRTKN